MCTYVFKIHHSACIFSLITNTYVVQLLKCRPCCWKIASLISTQLYPREHNWSHSFRVCRMAEQWLFAQTLKVVRVFGLDLTIAFSYQCVGRCSVLYLLVIAVPQQHLVWRLHTEDLYSSSVEEYWSYFATSAVDLCPCFFQGLHSLISTSSAWVLSFSVVKVYNWLYISSGFCL